MRNRFGIEVKKGYHVFARTARGDAIEGRAVKVAREAGRGVVVTLDSGITVGIDDVSQVLPPMRVTRGGVVKANPEIHVDINSHNANPKARKLSISWNTFAGGTGAWNPNHNSYSARTGLGTLYVDPPQRRGGAWSVRFSNDLGRVDGGLWRSVGTASSAAAGKKLAREWIEALAGESAMYSSALYANPLRRVRVMSASQRTGERPSARLVKRRKATAKAPAGVYANPFEGLKPGAGTKQPEFTYIVQAWNAATGDWSNLAAFQMVEPATKWARDYHRKFSTRTVRVVDRYMK